MINPGWVRGVVFLAVLGMVCTVRVYAGEEQLLASGVTLQIETRTQPRPLRLYWIEADLSAPGVKIDFTVPDPESILGKPAFITARKPTEILQASRWKVLLNGDAFFVVGDEQKKYPAVGDKLCLQGFIGAAGKLYGVRSPNNGTFYVLNDRKTMGLTYGLPPKDTWGAVGGYRIVLENGKINETDKVRIHPRSVIGFKRDSHKVYFLVVDGRQPGRSEGASERELGEWMRSHGATDALCLDGGGSSILVVEENGGARVINQPVGLYDQPGTIRPIGNAVGIIVSP
jgi:hypothetical protein